MRHYTRDSDGAGACIQALSFGLDVDSRSIAVSVHDGRSIVQSLTMPYDARNLLSFVEGHYAGSEIAFAYEAGPTGFGLYDSLTGAGYRCLVVSPGSVPDAPNNRIKTNRLDSKKLAILLAGNQLRGIRVPPESIRQLRSLVHLRYTYMQDIRAYKCRVKAELLKEGLRFPKSAKGCGWSNKVMAELRNLECAAITSFKINSFLDHIEHVDKEVRLTEVALRSHVNGDEDLRLCIKYLMSCPGIGWRIACYTLARFGDWKCLGSGKEAGAFFGLVPMENSTGDRTDRGSITRCGDPRLRSMLIQGAWTAIQG
jgi:transposase